MKRKTITVDEVMALNPCEGYDRGRVEALFDGRKRVKVPDIVGADIPARDRIWLLIQDHFFTEKELRLFARWCAWRVRDLWPMPDVVRRYLLTGEGRDAARSAAAAAVAAASAYAAVYANANAAGSAARYAESHRQLGALQLLAEGRLTVETDLKGHQP